MDEIKLNKGHEIQFLTQASLISELFERCFSDYHIDAIRKLDPELADFINKVGYDLADLYQKFGNLEIPEE